MNHDTAEERTQRMIDCLKRGLKRSDVVRLAPGRVCVGQRGVVEIENGKWVTKFQRAPDVDVSEDGNTWTVLNTTSRDALGNLVDANAEL